MAVHVFSCCVTGADWPSSYLLMTQKENEFVGHEGLVLENIVELVLYFKHLTFVNQASEEKAVEKLP